MSFFPSFVPSRAGLHERHWRSNNRATGTRATHSQIYQITNGTGRRREDRRVTTPRKRSRQIDVTMHAAITRDPMQTRRGRQFSYEFRARMDTTYKLSDWHSGSCKSAACDATRRDAVGARRSLKRRAASRATSRKLADESTRSAAANFRSHL